MKKQFRLRRGLAIIAVIALGLAAFAWSPAKLIARTAAASPRKNQQGAPPQATAPKPGPATQSHPSMVGKTAGDYPDYMNIRILKDIPADQLLPSMHYMTAALGVECGFCHVRGDFAKDDKQEKQTARKMMTMMFAINKDNFGGRRQVTCYTCHQGAAHPASVPMLPGMAASGPAPMRMEGIGAAPMMAAAGNGQPGPATGQTASPVSLPAPTEILAKYRQALGGDDAIQKVSTLTEQGTVDRPLRGAQIHATMDVYRKTPGKALATLHLPNREVTEGFDGSVGWEQRDGNVSEEAGDQLRQTKEWAVFIPGLNLAKNPRARVLGTQKIGDHDAYRLAVFMPGAGPEQFFFDVQSGLLLRISSRVDTPLGALPQDTDYDDYRDVSGIKVPFTIRVAHMDGTEVYKWTQVQANVPVDDSRFTKPASKAAATPSN